MPRFLHILDRIIESGIVAVLVFTPLAFGAVEPWSRSTAQILILLVTTSWVLKVIWTPARPSSRFSSRTILGGRVRLSGLEWPGLLFAAVICLQIVPLPPGIVRAVSPKTAELFSTSLPGYGTAAEPSFAGLPQWLEDQAPPDAGGVPVLAPDPGAAARAMPESWFETDYASWRPLSLTPAHTRRALGVFLAHLAFFVVVFNQLDRKKSVNRLLYSLVGLVGLLSLIGIFQNLTAEGKLYWWRGGGRTSFGPFANANNFAGWMEMALPLAIGLVFVLWRRRESRDSRAPARVLLVGFAAILGLTSFVLAQSRGGFLALLGAMVLALIVLAVARRLRLRMVALLLIPVVLAVGMAAWIDWPALRERYGTLADVSQERSFQERMTFSRVTLQMAADFPILGSGLGTFRETYALYTPGTSKRELARAHNDYAQLASECGIAGVLAMLWALGLLVGRGVLGGLTRSYDGSRWYDKPVAIGVLALLLHSFMDFNLQIYSNGILFIFLASVLMHSWTQASTDRQTRNA